MLAKLDTPIVAELKELLGLLGKGGKVGKGGKGGQSLISRGGCGCIAFPIKAGGLHRLIGKFIKNEER